MRTNPDLCPENYVQEIQRYVEHGLEPGGFLTAVLSNNLTEAFQRADDAATEALPHIVGYIYNRIPSNTWGSPAKVAAFLAAKRQS